MLDGRWMSVTTCPDWRSYHCRFRCSVALAKLHNELAESPPVRPRPVFAPGEGAEKGRFICTHDIRHLNRHEATAIETFGEIGFRVGRRVMTPSNSRARAFRLPHGGSRPCASEDKSVNRLSRVCGDRGRRNILPGVATITLR